MSEKGEKTTKATPMDEKQTSRPASPSPVTIAATLSVPTAPITTSAAPEGRATRSSSPSGLPAELVCKSRTQMSRIDILKTMLDKLPETIDQTSLDEVVAYLQQVEEVHKAFQKEHAYLEVTWPKAYLSHDYLTGGWYEHEMCVVLELRRRLHKLKAALQKIAMKERPTSSDAGGARRVSSKLPDINIPPFSGRYEDWPAFRDLFHSLIIKNEQLSGVEKLHYLRSCLRGDTTHVISSLPFTDDSFPTAWRNMKHRFENKRVILQSILDKLHTTPPVHGKTSTTLHNVAANLQEITSSLRKLGNAEEVRDFMVIHQISRGLDKATQKEWEISLGTSEELPATEKFDDFLRTKARGLERVEQPTATTTSTQPTKTKPTVSRAALTVQPRAIERAIKHAYECDACGADHFVVSCPKFRAMPVQEKRQLVDKLSLCRNCCGRHATVNCKSEHRCKHCGKPHHSLLHLEATLPKEPPAPQSSGKAAQEATTSSSTSSQ